MVVRRALEVLSGSFSFGLQQALSEAIVGTTDGKSQFSKQYTLLMSASLWDIHLFIFVKATLKERFARMSYCTEVGLACQCSLSGLGSDNVPACSAVPGHRCCARAGQ
jgi:hypothetical protein